MDTETQRPVAVQIKEESMAAKPVVICRPNDNTLKLRKATRLPAKHAKVVRAHITPKVRNGGELYMLECGEFQDQESEVLVSTSLVQPDQTGYFRVLIENHGMCPVNLEANHVMGVLASAFPVPMEKVLGL